MGLLSTWERFTAHWPVMVKSEIRHPRLPRQIAQKRDRLVAPESECSTTDVSWPLTPTTRERRVPTTVLAESPKTSPSEQTLSVSRPRRQQGGHREVRRSA